MDVIYWIQGALLTFITIAYALLIFWIIPNYVQESEREFATDSTNYAYRGMVALFTAQALIIFFGNHYEAHIALYLQASLYVISIITYITLQIWVFPKYLPADKKTTAATYTNYAFTAVIALLASQSVLGLFGVVPKTKSLPINSIGEPDVSIPARMGGRRR